MEQQLLCQAHAGHLSYYYLSILHVRSEKPQSLGAAQLVSGLPNGLSPCSRALSSVMLLHSLTC